MTARLFVSGHGVFTLTASGAMEPRPQWRQSIDSLCRAVAQAVGANAEVRYHSYPASNADADRPRMVGVDVTGALGAVYLNISISTRGDPCAPDTHDLPALDTASITSGSDLDFWMANECDTLCLVARLFVTLDHGASFVIVPDINRTREHA